MNAGSEGGHELLLNGRNDLLFFLSGLDVQVVPEVDVLEVPELDPASEGGNDEVDGESEPVLELTSLVGVLPEEGGQEQDGGDHPVERERSGNDHVGPENEKIVDEVNLEVGQGPQDGGDQPQGGVQDPAGVPAPPEERLHVEGITTSLPEEPEESGEERVDHGGDTVEQNGVLTVLVGVLCNFASKLAVSVEFGVALGLLVKRNFFGHFELAL